jgi:hypothetical protein
VAVTVAGVGVTFSGARRRFHSRPSNQAARTQVAANPTFISKKAGERLHRQLRIGDLSRRLSEL